MWGWFDPEPMLPLKRVNMELSITRQVRDETVVGASLERFAKTAEATRDFDLRRQLTSTKTPKRVIAADADENGGEFHQECKIRNT